MFVLISTLISIAILAGIYHLAAKREKQHARKYQLLTLLRDVVQLLRRHRAVTHYSIQCHQNHEKEIEHIHSELSNKLHLLVETSRFENKPMYRVLQIKIDKLMEQWEDNSIARNQMEHGRLIRHSLFLMDEVTIAWLAIAQRDELNDEYHMNWQTVMDSLETLTQLRISIQDMEDRGGPERMRNYGAVMIRKLNQLSVISPLSLASPTSARSIQALNEYISGEVDTLTMEELYDITSDLSLTVFNTYDHILSDIIEILYQPLPRLSLA
ncbi:hypothetical protein [Vibrio hyugaensis]|uniref:Nitrate/nitrite sensing protein domain-containing protein n=1 Tax=Vibrio hyugaensis TaxID=1534743 RepID=A0ABQ5XYK2_9VIBR|nr:hypothetical protein [Vibrio hyugaensis]GLR02824.1 hypothetical protein GCM10007906_04110 [Vibrio hyugaensis]